MSSNQVVPIVIPRYDRVVKLSVSLPDVDVDFVDQYGEEHGIPSRSAVLQRAVALLRASELGADYAAAWAEWTKSEADLWETTDDDGAG